MKSTPRPLTHKRILQRCVRDPDTGCRVWNGAINSQGNGNLSVMLASGKFYGLTIFRAVAALRLGLTAEELAAKKDFRAWTSCKHPQCCEKYHNRSGTRQDHIDWMRGQGLLRHYSAPAKAAHLKAVRKNVSGSMGLARAIRAARADKVPVRHIVALTGLSDDMVYRIERGKNWREDAVPGTSVFNQQPQPRSHPCPS